MAARNCSVALHINRLVFVVMISDTLQKPTSSVLHLVPRTKEGIQCSRRPQKCCRIPAVEYIHWFWYLFFDCARCDLWRPIACHSRLPAQPSTEDTGRLCQWQGWCHIWERSSGPLAGRTAEPRVLESIQSHLHPRACVATERMELTTHGFT